jgi:hypothetical protein
MKKNHHTKKKFFLKSWVPVTQAYNPSYLGGRDQEDCDLRPVWANSSQDTTKGLESGSSGKAHA